MAGTRPTWRGSLRAQNTVVKTCISLSKSLGSACCHASEQGQDPGAGQGASDRGKWASSPVSGPRQEGLVVRVEERYSSDYRNIS